MHVQLKADPTLKHVPPFLQGLLAAQGFPVVVIGAADEAVEFKPGKETIKSDGDDNDDDEDDGGIE